jgi:uncharacterized membrane protein
MKSRLIALNAVIAAVYFVVAYITPATAFVNLRISTALYVLAAWNPALIPGLVAGNALAGAPQGGLDVLLGGAVGLLTAGACALLGKRFAWLAVAVVPTLVVPLWLGYLFGVPYMAVVPALAIGQVISAVAAFFLLRAKALERLVSAK